MKVPGIIVIGAGASGMTAAIEAAKRGFKVTIIEANDKPGKKIYATGNGKCNLTNKKMDVSCFRGSDIKLIASVLERFGYKDTINYFSELGLMFKDRNGYIYPASGQASSVVKSLVLECEKNDIKILCKVTALNVLKSADIFTVETDNGNYKADGVILSTGSKAGILPGKLPKINGYDITKKLGHKIIPLQPALTGIKCKNNAFYKEVQGVRCDGKIMVYSDNRLAGSDMGELQLTSYGISGIPAFQVSRYAAYSLYNKKNTYIQVDFMPDISSQELISKITYKIHGNPNIKISEYLNGILNNKLAEAIVNYAGINKNITGRDIKEGRDKKRIIGCLVQAIKEYKDKVTGVNEFKDAQVLAGGVSLKEIKKNMESAYVKNLYITGEVLDADGICGGYNLQWAWATGYIAGNSILKSGEKYDKDKSDKD